ncbi:MAG TPA: hypothetical protein VHM70_01825 [Polyangiaceae bacterium]|nr:hypothetical protein [Polyangiaceae bacterium]
MHNAVARYCKRAKQASDGLERRQHLLRAIEHARTYTDWFSILLAIEREAQARDLLASVAEQMLSAARREGLSAGFVGTARALRQLGDATGAAASLDEGVERARNRGDIDGLCTLGHTFESHDDRTRATSLAESAEALLAGDPMRVWSVVSLWHDVDESERAARVLLAAARSASTFEVALHVAEYPLRDLGKAHVAVALDRACALARSAGEWFAIAEQARKASNDPQRVRAALDRAAAYDLSGDADLRARIALAYADWLDDTVAADAIGPRGVRPEALRTVRRQLTASPGSASALFDALRMQLSAAELQEIARADYGDDSERHAAALKHIQATGLVPPSLAWHPHEVVTLTRWSTGPGTAHVARAFCCTLLLLCADDETRDAAPILLESCLVLGGDLPAFATELFTWYASSDARFWGGSRMPEALGDDEDEGADPAVLLALLISLAANNPDARELESLSQRLLEESWYDVDEIVHDGMRDDLWLTLVSQYLVPLRARRPALDRLVTELKLAE